ncbi:UvrB/uvrC motif family protein [Histomonas meleagridis]|uniref:UvrB/uvrC motif family protein n=1 Tax=Histomonas meleagridis TaxID=135588 RepID=UPI0035595591|nr:UvrB/uvrC motif family protein [Histomonas meleagridis]KAH0801586.1 UvrB/uvrC motif family protein [Histomonas meleagridis]
MTERKHRQSLENPNRSKNDLAKFMVSMNERANQTPLDNDIQMRRVKKGFTPRVIGVKKEAKKADPKKPKFAKKSVTIATPDQNNQIPVPSFNFTSESEENVSSNYQSDSPTKPENDNEVYAFDFASESQPLDSSAQSEFSFGATKTTEQSNDNSFSFTNESNEKETTQSPPTEENSFAFAFVSSGPGQQHESSELRSESESESLKPFEITSNETVNYDALQRAVNEATRAVDEDRKALRSSGGINNEMLQQKFEKSHSNLISLLDQAMFIANKAAEALEERHTNISSIINDIKQHQTDTEQRLHDLEQQQLKDEQNVKSYRMQNSASIDSIRKNVDTKQSQLNMRRKQLEMMENDSTEPLATRLAAIEEEKSDLEEKITSLLKQIEEHKQRIAALDKEYEEKCMEYEEMENKFSTEKTKLEAEERTISIERAQCESKIKQIEAPYQSLLDNVNRRTKKIEILKEQLNDYKKQMSDIQIDAVQSEPAAQIIENMCKNHVSVVEKRNLAKEKLERAKKTLEELENFTNPNTAELPLLRSKVATTNETLTMLKQKLNQLEASKKNAIQTKNFMQAKTLTQNIKETQEQINANEAIMKETNNKINTIVLENSEQAAQLDQAKEDIEDAKFTILDSNYSYFESTIAVLDGLFELSPYATKLLKPLQAIMLHAVLYLEQPPKLNKESIQQKIDALSKQLDMAIEKEDYEEAERLQKQIDELSAKLTH